MISTDVIKAGSDPLRKRILFYLIGGVLAGSITVPLLVIEELVFEAVLRCRSWTQFADFCSPFGPTFWPFVFDRLRLFAVGPISGALYGALIGVFARGPQIGGHMLRVATYVGLLFSFVTSLVLAIVPGETIALLIAPPFSFIYGAAFGGSAAFFTRLAERLSVRLGKK